jgi:beta-phosphoglucomutase
MISSIPIRGILLDYDGVLADTMPDNHKAWSKAFAEAGIHITQEEYYLLEGSGRLVVAQELSKLHGLPHQSAEWFARRKDEIMVQDSASPLFEGVQEAMKLWKSRSISLALVTGASRSRIKAKLSPEIVFSFDVIITSDDVTYTKPHPEPYLKAIEQLNLPSESCLVIENAPLGIRSAKAAGARCFAITTTLPANYLMEADAIFSNHQDCFRHIEDLLSKSV